MTVENRTLVVRIERSIAQDRSAAATVNPINLRENRRGINR